MLQSEKIQPNTETLQVAQMTMETVSRGHLSNEYA